MSEGFRRVPQPWMKQAGVEGGRPVHFVGAVVKLRWNGIRVHGTSILRLVAHPPGILQDTVEMMQLIKPDSPPFYFYPP